MGLNKGCHPVRDCVFNLGQNIQNWWKSTWALCKRKRTNVRKKLPLELKSICKSLSCESLESCTLGKVRDAKIMFPLFLGKCTDRILIENEFVKLAFTLRESCVGQPGPDLTFCSSSGSSPCLFALSPRFQGFLSSSPVRWCNFSDERRLNSGD